VVLDMIKCYKIININKNPYYDSISTIVSRHRNENTKACLLKSEITNNDRICVLIIDGLVVSILRYFYTNGNYYVNLVHTLEEYRKRGYSTDLFRYLFGKLSKSTIVLECYAELVPFYEGLGFKVVSFDDVYVMKWGLFV